VAGSKIAGEHNLAMTKDYEATTSPTVLLPLAEAALRLALHPSALRSRIRRGTATAKRGNDGRLLVEVPADARPVHDLAMASPDQELLAEVIELRERAARAEAMVEAKAELVAELRLLLDHARQPFWRRWFG
jgi:hypothetical protein